MYYDQLDILHKVVVMTKLLTSDYCEVSEGDDKIIQHLPE